jgi:hypothetical protein
VPNPNLTIRNFSIAVRQAFLSGGTVPKPTDWARDPQAQVRWTSWNQWFISS